MGHIWVYMDEAASCIRSYPRWWLDYFLFYFCDEKSVTFPFFYFYSLYQSSRWKIYDGELGRWFAQVKYVIGLKHIENDDVKYPSKHLICMRVKIL